MNHIKPVNPGRGRKAKFSENLNKESDAVSINVGSNIHKSNQSQNIENLVKTNNESPKKKQQLKIDSSDVPLTESMFEALLKDKTQKLIKKVKL